MPPNGSIGFVDTSVHVALRTHQDKERVRERLRNYERLATSTDAKREFRHSCIRGAIYVYNRLVDGASLADIVHDVNRLSRQTHLMSNALLALAAFFADEGQVVVTGALEAELRRVQTDYFRRTVRRWWRQFGRGMQVLDVTGCVMVPHELPMRGERFEPTMGACDSRECRLSAFIEGNREAFGRIVTALSAEQDLRPQDAKMVQSIEGAVGGPDQAVRTADCWNMGDAVIAVTCPPEATLVSRDRVFEVLAPALSKRVDVLPHTCGNADRVQRPGLDQ